MENQTKPINKGQLAQRLLSHVNFIENELKPTHDYELTGSIYTLDVGFMDLIKSDMRKAGQLMLKEAIEELRG